MHNGVGAPNGPRTNPFDRWFRYPAGFGGDALDQCFNAIHIPEGAVVVDPFAGVGTTGVRSSKLGFAFLGIEAHPLIAEVAALKFIRPATPTTLVARAHTLVQDVAATQLGAEHPLIMQSFESETLMRLTYLRDRIQALTNDPWQLHLKWCLLGALRDCASVKVGWPYQRPAVTRTPRMADPERAFIRRAQWMAEDLAAAPASPAAAVHVGDARVMSHWITALVDRQAAAIITSPPYLNNFDYADATRLELYFWGIARSWLEMTTHVRSSMVIASTQQSRKRLATDDTAAFAAVCPRTAAIVAALTEELQRERRARPRGKEYDQVLPSYFADLTRVLINIRMYTISGAHVALVLGDSAPYGVHIDTPALLATVGEELGFSCESILTLRRRGLRWHKNGVRHAVALSEQLVLLRAPGPG